MKAQKKPVPVEASQWFAPGDHPKEVQPLPETTTSLLCTHCGGFLRGHGWLATTKGGLLVCPGDWIVTEENGKVYPCKPDVFDRTFEPAINEPAPPAQDTRPHCPDCGVEMVKFSIELEDGSGWICGWLCDCTGTEESGAESDGQIRIPMSNTQPAI